MLVMRRPLCSAYPDLEELEILRIGMSRLQASDTHSKSRLLEERIEGLDADIALETMIQADEGPRRFQGGFKAYATAVKQLIFEDCEGVFREYDMKTFLVAKQQEVSNSDTIVML